MLPESDSFPPEMEGGAEMPQVWQKKIQTESDFQELVRILRTCWEISKGLGQTFDVSLPLPEEVQAVLEKQLPN